MRNCIVVIGFSVVRRSPLVANLGAKRTAEALQIRLMRSGFFRRCATYLSPQVPAVHITSPRFLKALSARSRLIVRSVIGGG